MGEGVGETGPGGLPDAGWSVDVSVGKIGVPFRIKRGSRVCVGVPAASVLVGEETEADSGVGVADGNSYVGMDGREGMIVMALLRRTINTPTPITRSMMTMASATIRIA